MPDLASLDLNADLGESYGWYKFGVDTELMGLISSANIACGFHAGDSRTMRITVELAAAQGVRIGAHMGLPDRLGFGRRVMEISGEDAYDYTLHQMGALNAFAARSGVPLHHIKPHGALYMMAARDPEVADGIARAAHDHTPGVAVYAMPRTALAKAAERYRLPLVGEFFADRPYVHGQVMMFGWTLEQIGSPPQVAQRVLAMLNSDCTGDIGTVCIHTDTPGAVAMMTAVRDILTAAGVHVRPPG